MLGQSVTGRTAQMVTIPSLRLTSGDYPKPNQERFIIDLFLEPETDAKHQVLDPEMDVRARGTISE